MLGCWTEAFNRQWYEKLSGERGDRRRSAAHLRDHSAGAAARSTALSRSSGAIFEAKHTNASSSPRTCSSATCPSCSTTWRWPRPIGRSSRSSSATTSMRCSRSPPTGSTSSTCWRPRRRSGTRCSAASRRRPCPRPLPRQPGRHARGLPRGQQRLGRGGGRLARDTTRRRRPMRRPARPSRSWSRTTSRAPSATASRPSAARPARSPSASWRSMSAPQVYRAITAIAAELSGGGIPKRHRNERDDYRYRSIDDVLNRLVPAACQAQAVRAAAGARADRHRPHRAMATCCWSA